MSCCCCCWVLLMKVSLQMSCFWVTSVADLDSQPTLFHCCLLPNNKTLQLMHTHSVFWTACHYEDNYNQTDSNTYHLSEWYYYRSFR
jgi:hypothetical protein